MSSDKTGGPAFPQNAPINPGISYLDYMARGAMMSLLRYEHLLRTMTPAQLLADAYKYAAAGLAEKRRRENTQEAP